MREPSTTPNPLKPFWFPARAEDYCIRTAAGAATSPYYYGPYGYDYYYGPRVIYAPAPYGYYGGPVYYHRYRHWHHW